MNINDALRRGLAVHRRLSTAMNARERVRSPDGSLLCNGEFGYFTVPAEECTPQQMHDWDLPRQWWPPGGLPENHG